MQLVGAGNQSKYHYKYDASGTITTGGAAQLLLPQSPSRSMLLIQNTSLHNMYVEFGGARAVATITNGVVTSAAVTNAGFNYTKPPLVRFIGGGFAGNSSYLGLNVPMGEGPNSTLGPGRLARARVLLTANAVSSIVIDDGGEGYAIAPFMQLLNSDLDPYGCALPAANVGVYLAPAGGSYYVNGTSCPTDAIAIWGVTTADPFTCKWMT